MKVTALENRVNTAAHVSKASMFVRVVCIGDIGISLYACGV